MNHRSLCSVLVPFARLEDGVGSREVRGSIGEAVRFRVPPERATTAKREEACTNKEGKMALFACPRCSGEMSDQAFGCPTCAYPFYISTPPVSAACRWKPGVAAALSLLIPGAGQLYKGQIVNGLAWLCAVLLSYAFLFAPGLLLHLCCVIGAAKRPNNTSSMSASHQTPPMAHWMHSPRSRPAGMLRAPKQ